MGTAVKFTILTIESPSAGDSGTAPVRPNDDTPASLLLLAAMIVGAIGAVALLPSIFLRLPHDLVRTKTILRALTIGKARMVVFGDSRAEAGVDASRLSPLAFNLSSHSQTLAQAYLFCQELPDSVRVIIQIVTPQQLGSPAAFDTNVYNTMYMYGYRPTEETKRTLTGAFGMLPDLALSDAGQRLEARWPLRQVLESWLRHRVRRDLTLTREQDDLFFPTAYTARISKLSFEKGIQLLRDRPTPVRIAPQQRRILTAMAVAAKSSSRRLLLVVAPVHPRAIGPSSAQFANEVHRFAKENGVWSADATSLLDDGQFVDPLHANQRGAQKLTSFIATRLRAIP